MTSWPLTVTLLWVSLGRCGGSGSPDPGCDTGKVSLRRDLPVDAGLWSCPSWSEPPQNIPGVDKVYDPQPARKVCVNKLITYTDPIPNSGSYRPIEAQTGRYLYCPPQRWLNNVHKGAVVLLYHPCAPTSDRLLLSAVAKACLPHYIMTPHPQLNRTMPVALVSWGRTLELSSAASLELCDWLQTTATSFRNGVNQASKYKLYLVSKPGPRRPPSKAYLRRCCRQTITTSAANNKNRLHAVKEDQELPRERRDSVGAKQEVHVDVVPAVESRPVKTNLSRDFLQQLKKSKPRAPEVPSKGERSRKRGKKVEPDVDKMFLGSEGVKEREVEGQDVLQHPGTSPAEVKDEGVMSNGRTPRTDDAFWAAAALGFLLLLLVASVLYTRLYRHWRIAPSLYWPEHFEDYDNVADVIRRRLRLTKKRRKRSRRKEFVHLPSSSSSDEQL